MYSFGGGPVEAAQTRTHPGLGREYELPMPYSLIHQSCFLDMKAAEGIYFFCHLVLFKGNETCRGFWGSHESSLESPQPEPPYITPRATPI